MIFLEKMKKKDGNKKPEVIFDRMVPFITGAFFCFLLVFFGVGQYPDSETYLHYYSDREPLYPLFLKVCRMAAGDAHVLWAAVIFQNVLAFFCFWYLYRFITRQFQLNLLFRIAVLLIILMPHLMTSVFTSSGIVLTNAILSEGLTVSLYPLFATILFEAFYREKKGRFLAASYIVALLLALARGQLMTMLLVWLLVSAAIIVREWILLRKSQEQSRSAQPTEKSHRSAQSGRVCAISILALFLLTIAGFVIRQSVIHVYHSAMTDGRIRSNTGANVTLLTNVLYCADEQAVLKAADTLSETDAQLLRGLYAQMRSEKLCASDAGDGFHARIWHHEDSHDKIKFDILGEYLRMAAWAERETLPESAEDGSEIRVIMDKTGGRLMKALLPHCIGSYLTTYLYVAAGGFVRTVSLLSPVFSIYALFIYAAAVVLMCVLFRKAQGRAAAWLMAIVLLMTAANVCATALTIMCLSRYMIYNMSLFYLAGLVCVWEAYRIRRGGTSGAEICTQPE